MSVEQNKNIARRFLLEAFGQGQLALLDELLASTYVDHNAPPGTPPGPAGIHYIMTSFRAAFPDLKFTIEDELAENDKVALRYTFRGTHRGDLFGIPATGQPVVMAGISVYRIAQSRLQEAWVNYDMLGLMQQIGALPMPGR